LEGFTHEEQIRENMFRPLKGTEPGLVGLWNFADSATPAKDATTNGHHGVLKGNARAVPTELPALMGWPAAVSGVVTDEAGKPIPDAGVLVEAGASAQQTKTDTAGRYAIAITPNLPYALSAITPELASESLDLRLQAGETRTLDLKLRAATGVLDLDGNGSYVELPPNVFNELTEATVEVWVRAGERLDGKWLFTYGEEANDLTIDVPWSERTIWYTLASKGSGLQKIELSDIVRPKQWTHVAAVSGPGGMKLYLNGTPAGTRDFGGSFNSLESGARFRFGAATSDAIGGFFSGQVDEIRVWDHARSQDQVRETMFRTLTGAEAGLVGYWNFDDPAQPGRDYSAGGHHGKLIGRARVRRSVLPQASELPGLLKVVGRVVDTAGNPAANASVKLSAPNPFEVSAHADENGWFTIPFWERPTGEFALEARSADQIVWRTGLKLAGERRYEINLHLSDSFTVAGTVRSLDQTQPLARS
jgi:hypothetical protein